MAETKDAIMKLVVKELQRDPNASTSDLFELAKRVDPSIADLKIRQFHARYPLQVKRKQALSGDADSESTKSKPKTKGAARKKKSTPRKRTSRAGTKKSAGRRGSTGSTRRKGATRKKEAAQGSAAGSGSSSARETIRQELVKFAQALYAASEDPAKLVRLGADIDGYADRILKAADKE